MRPLRLLRRRWRETVSVAVIAAGVLALVLSAVFAAGVPVRRVDLNDGGIWVTSDHDGLFGRLNRPAGALDAALYPPGGAQQSYALDVVQDGKAVAAWDKGTGRLIPVDIAHGVAVGDQGTAVAAAQQVQLAGGTLAVLDPQSGRIWAVRADPGRGLAALGGLDPAAAPLATVGTNAVLAVGMDGTVHAVAADGRLVAVRPAGDGFGSPEYTRIPPLHQPRITVVGAQAVTLDAASGRLTVPGTGTAVTVDGVDEHTVLQQPGPAAASVVLATARTLLAVGLAEGGTTRLGGADGGEPTAPVRLGDCVHAAWSGAAGGYFRACGGAPAARGNLKNAQVLERPVFRVNRGAIVLNDLSTGAVWDLADQRRVDDWSSVRPPPRHSDGDKQQTKTDAPLAQSKPRAVDDTLGARPGRTTLLYLLDNDSDPAGAILTITATTAPDDPAVHAVIASDGQSVALTVPAQARPGASVHFRYTADDGHATAEAGVTVQIRGTNDNKAPAPRPGYKAPPWTVPAGGQLSMPVLADWRDFDGDPIALTGASVKAGTVTTTPAGSLVYAAPADGGVQHLSYQVSDGIAPPVAGSADVTVLAATATSSVPATAQPDVARGQVGQPITIRPLDNDLPGADPANPGAVLALAGELPSPANTTVVTNLRDGTVVLTASKPGPYQLEYKAAFGNAPFARGQIRVDVVPAPSSPQPPVAMPDSAVLRGQLPATVDVLANDFSPSGGVLVVQRAAAADPATRLSVAVVEGHWLRIAALSASSGPGPQIVRYTVTDGITAPVAGEVTVTVLTDPPDVRPAPQDDAVTVRAGDTTVVAVLANDTNPGGAPMFLAADVPGAPGPGRLSISSAKGGDEDTAGRAYVSGDLVRYVAPAAATAPLQVTVDYVVRNTAGDQATGHLRVTVRPGPGDGVVNHPPAPPPLEARAVAGQTIRISVPTAGVDPDGDTVAVAGLGSAPALGRVLSVNATSLEYQAYPTSAGTDTFIYRVTDRFGAVGEAAIRVGIAPPGAPQPPVAVDDEVTAAPGARLHVDVLANDLLGAGDAVTVVPLRDAPAGVTLAGKTGPIDLTVPAADGKPLVVVYAITDGVGEPSTATLTVRGQPGYDIPPVVFDAYPAADGATVTVDIGKQVVDPDGDAAAVTVTRVFDPAAQFAGRTVTAPVTGRPYTVAYEVRDAGGATAVGLIHVPVPGAGAPYATPGRTVTLDRDGSARAVDLADYVTDPAGKAVRLTTTEKLWASPVAALAAKPDGDRTVVLSARGGYTGPGALTFEVTDGTSLTDPAAQLAVVTIPVQVGPPTPVLHCPADPLPVVEGGATVTLDITSVCHVWAPDPGTLPDLRYTLQWKTRPAGAVDLAGDGEHTGTVTAGAGSPPGSAGVIAVGVKGFDGVAAELAVRVVAAAPPSVAPITVDGVKAGEPVTVELPRYVHSQLREPRITALSAAQSAGMPATVSVNGPAVQITPGADSHGTMTFAVTVTDVTDPGRTDRQATARITLHVLGPPDAPGTPAVDRTVLSRSAALSWTAPPNNGAPIDRYEVAWAGGTQSCPASPCLITGLTNGQDYTFIVKAHNLVGWSRPSGASAVAQPDTVPGAVTGLATADSQDHTLRLTWSVPPNDGTPVVRYDVTWTGGGRATATGPALTATGLDNDVVYTFTVVAVNAKGPGEAATVQGQSAGTPPAPAAPEVASVDSADSSARAVTVSWPAVDPNGPGPVTYTVTRGAKTVCAAVTARSCTDDGLANDGTVYTYTVAAANAAGHASAAGPGTRLEAASTPGPITGVSAAATGTDGQATLRFDVPASHGASNTVTCTWSGGGCGTWTYPTGGQPGAVQTVNGLPNGQAVSLSLQACNGSSGGSGSGSPCDATVSTGVTTYGPLKNLGITSSAAGTVVSFTVSVDPNGKPATVTVQTSRQTQTFATGVGAWSWSGSDDVGYSATDTINVTVSDGGRSPLSQSKQQSTPTAPAARAPAPAAATST